ncbi:DNA ligase D [Flavobacterium cyanobacteriorum]|uniref:DNA ligase (ATP) n=1 Tax=Flavobacterium cyanobacteriorum TaxID=2022802 RepID=A0A255YRQ4_9FLAO|nr:DNA ligase D [Flavobacterium cyanobacteriorum]OYQ31889.1 DNA ligase D [Flavobacterium cyanobacteriorum]
MKLSEYNRKRDFSKTAEPKGKIKKSGREPRFVIQKHAASHLHYDFRLEIDGVLVSWAVPKGPVADPSVKRLAMHVEDHPMDYIDFEGNIPKGQYGGGTVMVWDTGTYLPEGTDTIAESEKLVKKMYREGNIKIVMHGKKVKGSYHLVHMSGKEKEWLLMKGRDEYADKRDFDQHSVLTGRTLDEIENDKQSDVWQSNKADKNSKGDKDNILGKQEKSEKSSPTPAFTPQDVADAKPLKTFPEHWLPQLATLTDEVFDSDEWAYETKFDGYRALVQVKKGKVNLISRKGISFNTKYKELVEAFKIIKEDMILDGEIVVEDNDGKSHFQWLQYFAENPGRGKLKCYVFDILYFNGFDLTPLELLQRKRILEAVLPQTDNIVYSVHTVGDGAAALKEVEAKGGEGLIAKKITSRYVINKRSKEWLKIKVTKEQEMVIGGFTDPKGSRSGFGSLLLGYYENGELIYSGKCGTGFNEDSLKDMHKKLKKLEIQKPHFSVKPKERGAHWIKPELVAQIKYTEWTETGSLRHPVFIALRNDKDPKDVTREFAADTDKVVPELKAVKTVKKAGKDETADTVPRKSKKAKTGDTSVNKGKTKKMRKTSGKKGWDTGKVEVTNTDKIFWPEEGYTKGDVIAYYDEMAEWLLPYIENRPQSMRRTPDGIVKDGFFQKNVAGMVPDWIPTEKIHSESTGEDIEFLVCNDKDTLIYMANLGCIEINPWSSRVGSLDNPDYIIFDLDPNKASLKDLITTANKVREILDGLGIKGYLKTSGGKGLHVFIPVKPKYTYDQSRDFSHIISQAVHNALPDITSLERMPKKRIGKIYLDFLQNGCGKTMACAYSLRPREGATASTPLEWDEINEKGFDVKNFTIQTIPERVKKKGDLWEGFFDDALDLEEILASLG